MRFVFGTNGTPSLAVAKMPKVGVALALNVVVTLEAIDEMHCPLVGSVWQRLTVSGKVTAPVVAVAVMEALAPTLTVATAKALEPDVPVMCRMPSFYARGGRRDDVRHRCRGGRVEQGVEPGVAPRSIDAGAVETQRHDRRRHRRIGGQSSAMLPGQCSRCRATNAGP
jgi:hypothetical protein